MSRHGCLPTFKFTGWIIALLVVLIPSAITKLPPETAAYVDDGLYKHKALIEDHPRLYLKQLFRHFEAHFVDKGISDWHGSRLPQLLQDLGLLPKDYETPRAYHDRRLLSGFWTSWHRRTEALRQEETALPLNSQVQIPPQLVHLFSKVPGFVAETGTIRYREVVAAAQDIANNQYDIHVHHRKNKFITSIIKKYRFLAFFGMTVFDQFLGAVENQTGTSLETQVPRTLFVPEPVAGDHPRAEQVPPTQAQPRPAPRQPRPAPGQPRTAPRQPRPAPGQPRPAEPNVQPVPPQVAGPSGSRRGVNSGEGIAVPLAPPQAAGGPSSSGGNLEPMSPAKAPNIGSNKGIVPVAVAWKPWQVVAFQILDSMKEPIYRRDIHHWPGHVGGSYREQGEAGPLGPGASGGGGVGGNPAAAPNREAKRKATDQGTGPSQGGKRGPGGAMMRSVGGDSIEPRVGHKTHRARKFKSGAKSHRGHGHRA